ncbi:hypothetical protein [Rhodopseudomonas palustris]|uniref:hypothetical protein n=1 Tax=Rhodopseudomonas palustris TaxID=1076 RepID=UPI0011C34DC9|nr:hypothetical protein [Rhodopseudomonas palustris]
MTVDADQGPTRAVEKSRFDFQSLASGKIRRKGCRAVLSERGSLGAGGAWIESRADCGTMPPGSIDLPLLRRASPRPCTASFATYIPLRRQII